MRHEIAITGVFLCLTAAPAFADVGTPLMLFDFFHLVVGNILIGVLEGFLISGLFRFRFSRAVCFMVLANFVSMVCGKAALGLLAHVSSDLLLGDKPLHNVGKFVAGLAALSYFFSILIEWPFCIGALSPRKTKIGDGFKASFWAQSLSYLVLVPLYLHFTFVIPRPEIDRSLGITSDERVLIYYLSPEGNAVCRIRPDGSENQQVAVLERDKERVLLGVQPDTGEETWSLYARNGPPSGELEVPLEDLRIEKGSYWEDSFLSHASVLTACGESDWEISTSWGLEGYKPEAREELLVLYEYPFLPGWMSRFPTLLDGEQVVYQLGPQIVLYDISEKKIRVITKGRSPVVVLEKGGSEEEIQQ